MKKIFRSERSSLIPAFLVLCVAAALLSDRFLTGTNILNILRQSSINGVIAVGMTLVILTAGIDLSVGSILALSAVTTAQLLVMNIHPIPASLIGMLLGASLGFFNGSLIAFFKIPPFITTLGTMTFVRGLALSFTNGKPITGLPETFRLLGTGFWGPFPVPVIVSIGVFALTAIILRLTPQGERLYALGSNPKAARFTGIPVRLYTITVYAISGILAALAGQILIGRLNSAQPVMGIGYEFDAIAAVVVGGTSFTGGNGGLAGTAIGVLIIAIINNIMNLLNVSSFWEQVIKGVVIVLALLLNRQKSR